MHAISTAIKDMATKRSKVPRSKVPCGVCQAPITDGKDEALLCEGECGLWLHRGCASVPPCRYKALSESDEPFVCLCCSNSQLRRELSQVKMELSVAAALADAVELLKMEVKQLKETLAATTSELSSLRSNRPPARSTYASKAAARRPAQQARNRTATNRGNVNRSTRSFDPGSTPATRSADVPAPTSRERVPVEGVTGALKATSTIAIASTLQKLTSVGPTHSPCYISWKVNGTRSLCRQIGNLSLAPNRVIVCCNPLLPPTIHLTSLQHPQPFPTTW